MNAQCHCVKEGENFLNRLFIIGNGFDIEHGLPTRFDPHFKTIAQTVEQIDYFWDIYQSQQVDIWSDFENCLAHPDFNELEEIFNGYFPDYFSERESDRNAIIIQVDLNGNLYDALYVFADQAEDAIYSTLSLARYKNYFTKNDLFISMNYTHTLEKLYGINNDQILHIHGEVGKDNLLLGYPDGNFAPEKYYYDVRRKGVGPYVEVDIRSHIEDMLEDEQLDYYTYTAYKQLISKTESFYKIPQLKNLTNFLFRKDIEEIVVVGHSCKIDFPYFQFLNEKFPHSRWFFNPFDISTEVAVREMIENIEIKNYIIE